MSNTTLQDEARKLKETGVNVGLMSNEGDATQVVRIALDTHFLSTATAKQWGIIPKKPVVIQLKFDNNYTAADDIPGIFIFQSSDPKLSETSLTDYETEFGVVQWFLETRLTEVLRSNWEKRPDSVRQKNLSSISTSLSSTSSSSSSTTSSSSPPSPSKSTPSTTTSTTTTTTTTTLTKNNSEIEIPVDKEVLKQLISVGFSADSARNALKKFTNDFEMALNFLLSNPSDPNLSPNISDPGPNPISQTDSEMADLSSSTTSTDGNKMEIDTENTTTTDNSADTPKDTPTKGKNKRNLSVDDDNTLITLVEMGFDLDVVSDALSSHPSGTDADTIIAFIENPNSFHTPKKQKTSDPDDEKIEVLKGLGFSPKEAEVALSMTQGDLAKAVELVDNLKQEKEFVRTGVVPTVALNFDEEEEEEEEKLTYIPPVKRGRRTVRVRRGGRRSFVNDDDTSPLPDVANPEDIPAAKNEVNLWTEDNCFLVNLYNYINMRFITCPGFCLICDRDLDITTYKLPVCGRAECIRVYGSTACGANQVITEIKEQPEVVELLLNLLCTCMASPYVKGWNRNGNVLNTRFDGSDGSGSKQHGHYRHYGAQATTQSFEPFPYNLGFEFDDGSQNIQLLQKTIDSIPAVTEMQRCSSDVHLQALLEELSSPLAFPLLRWLLRSSRSHLSLIPANKQLAEMGTPHQFQIVSTNPEHERTFQKWKQQARKEKPKLTQAQRQQQLQYLGLQVAQKYVPRPGGGFMLETEANDKGNDTTTRNTGSFHAFHGSPISNWHSIVRTGLRGGHVPGIYMAQSAAVSQGYMQSGTGTSAGWKNSTWGCDKNVSCMGMVEVADLCHHQKILTGASPVGAPDTSLASIINVAMDYSIVVTRYLFFWPRGLFPGMDATKMYYGGSPFQNVLANKLIKNEFMFLDEEEDKEKEKEKETISL